MKKKSIYKEHNFCKNDSSNLKKLHFEEFLYEKQGDKSKQVFIDLDDAYGIPFSSGTFVLTGTTKQDPKKS